MPTYLHTERKEGYKQVKYSRMERIGRVSTRSDRHLQVISSSEQSELVSLLLIWLEEKQNWTP